MMQNSNRLGAVNAEAATCENPGQVVTPSPDSAKKMATLAAKLALRGFALRECETGGFFVSRWNLTKFCRDQSDVEDFAQTVGVKP